MKIQDYTTTLLAHMGVQGSQVEIVEEDEGVRVAIQVSEEDSGMMIGRRGETIEALQKIFSLTFREELGEKRITVAVNDYLDRRQEIVERIANEAIDRVSATNEPFTLPYLSSNERRYVHTLMKDKGVETQSDGTGRDRLLTVFPQGYLSIQSTNNDNNTVAKPAAVIGSSEDA
ncbi:MAG: R3H domain-containing nucleic acid-binding protein [Patescibacteria group bacterium]